MSDMNFNIPEEETEDITVSFSISPVVSWGEIGGTLSNQTDLQTALNGKQATLVSGTNIKTINNTSLLGSGNIVTNNYELLENLPTINNVDVIGDLTLEDLDIYSQSEVDTLLNGKEDADATILKQANVVNGVESTSTIYPLSANMGKSLQDEINNLKNIGRFLAIWNCATGLPLTNPTTLPYTYRTGDYYRVGTVGTTNYKPNGTTYDGTASSTVDSGDVAIGWVYYFDGTQWLAQSGGGGGTVQDVQINGTSIVGSGTGIANIVSGTNVKTINNNTILGSGNLTLNTIPSGGSAGNMLVKNSSTEGDASWVDAQAIYVGDGTSGSSVSINANTLENKSLLGLVNMFYPVGSFFFNENNANPSTYMTGTTWTLVGTRLTIDSRVYGNGKTLGITDGTTNGNLGLQWATANTGDFYWTNSFGVDLSSSGQGIPISQYVGRLGIPTKSQITTLGTGYEDATGLTTDYITCYIWKRTA